MSELDLKDISFLLDLSQSVEVILDSSSGLMVETISGKGASRRWDIFRHMYEVDVDDYDYLGGSEYRISLDYRHPLDDDWDRIVLRGYADRESV